MYASAYWRWWIGCARLRRALRLANDDAAAAAAADAAMSEAGALALVPSRNVGETPPSGPGPPIAYGTAAPTPGAGAAPAGAAPALTDGDGAAVPVGTVGATDVIGGMVSARATGAGRAGAGAGAGSGAGSGSRRVWRAPDLRQQAGDHQRQKYRSGEDHRPRGPAERLRDRLVGDEEQQQSRTPG